MAKLHAQAAQWEEYEDEYDDSFDDLAGYDADANADTPSEQFMHPPLKSDHTLLYTIALLPAIVSSEQASSRLDARTALLKVLKKSNNGKTL